MFGKALGGSVGRPGLGGYAVLFLFSFVSIKHYNRIPQYLIFEYLFFSFFSHCLSSHVQRSQLPNWDSRNLNLTTSPSHSLPHSPFARQPRPFVLALRLHRLRLSLFSPLGLRSILFCQRSIRYIISRLSPVPRLLLSLRVPGRPASIS